MLHILYNIYVCAYSHTCVFKGVYSNKGYSSRSVSGDQNFAGEFYRVRVKKKENQNQNK